MAISYPTSLDTLTNPTSSNTLDSPSHSGQHSDVNDAVEALETKVGADSSAVTTSHDYKLAHPNISIFNSFSPPEGYMINGKIVPSVASNNLTVALKGLDGNDPSATNPIYCRIGDTVHTITSALSVTVNAGANTFNAGSSELATYEIDYFPYLGYNATDGVVIGFSRIPYATDYSQFSATAANEKYCAISTITNAAAGDDYTVVGRFAATLSAGTGYTWTVPTFTTINLIQRPIFETRVLEWLPTYGGSGSLTFTSVTTTYAGYSLFGNQVSLSLSFKGTTGGTESNTLTATLPMSCASGYSTNSSLTFGVWVQRPGSVAGYVYGSTNTINVRSYDAVNYTLGTNRGAHLVGTYFSA